jgi:hypothetical protein
MECFKTVIHEIPRTKYAEITKKDEFVLYIPELHIYHDKYRNFELTLIAPARNSTQPTEKVVIKGEIE